MCHIAVVIPCYLVEKHIAEVISKIPDIVQTIIVVDDYSPDGTGNILEGLAKNDPRILVISHSQNEGVGGATKSGYREALRRNADIVIKLDGDGQMDSSYLGELIEPILSGKAEYTKGNRFYDWSFVQTMPWERKIGNLGLSFLTKVASGYWNVFDPTNGFTTIAASTLKSLNFNRLEQRYLFETSMLVELYRLRARIQQIPMHAIYKDEPSSLCINKSLVEFFVYLIKTTTRRFLHHYIWQDFTAVSVFVIIGVASIFLGTVSGVYHWIQSIKMALPATAGTVMISVLPIIFGFQMLLQSVVLDIQNTPK